MKEIVKIQKWVAVAMFAIVCMTIAGCSNDDVDEMLPYNAVGDSTGTTGIGGHPSATIYLWINNSGGIIWRDVSGNPRSKKLFHLRVGYYYPATMDGLVQMFCENFSSNYDYDQAKKYIEDYHSDWISMMESNKYQYITDYNGCTFFNRVSDVNY